MTISKYIQSVKSIMFNDKLPLTLSVLSQAYVLWLWLVGYQYHQLQWLTVIFAIISAASLDLIIVSTTFSKHHTKWSFTTALVALCGSVLLVIDYFYKLNLHFIHAIFPIMVFFYSNHLASSKQLAQIEIDEAIPLNVLEYRTAIIRKLIQSNKHNDAEIEKIAGGKSENTRKIITSIRDELSALEAGTSKDE